MNKITPQKYKELKSALPDRIRAYYESDQIGNAVETIGKSLKLRADEMGKLTGEIGYVVLGFKKASDFPSNVKERLGWDVEKTNKVVKEVNERVFEVIRRTLKDSGASEERQDTPSEELTPNRTGPSNQNAKESVEEKEEILRDIELAAKGDYPEAKDQKPETTKGLSTENVSKNEVREVDDMLRTSGAKSSSSELVEQQSETGNVKDASAQESPPMGDSKTEEKNFLAENIFQEKFEEKTGEVMPSKSPQKESEGGPEDRKSLFEEKLEQKTSSKKTYKGQDPYREPTE